MHKQNIQHPHAEILRAIADGKQIQYKLTDKWIDLSQEAALIMIGICINEFRIKPEVILINGIEVPKPCCKPPKLGTTYYYPYLQGYKGNHYSYLRWEDNAYDNRLLKLGIVHLTEEAAIKHAEALLSFTQTKE